MTLDGSGVYYKLFRCVIEARDDISGLITKINWVAYLGSIFHEHMCHIAMPLTAASSVLFLSGL
jgi:hypothetical protein